jgi:hypothetical protein
LGCLYSGITGHQKGAQERFVWITPEKALVIGEMAEKRFALPIGRVPGHIPSTIIGATPPHFVANISLTHKFIAAYISSAKSNALSVKSNALSVQLSVISLSVISSLSVQFISFSQ